MMERMLSFLKKFINNWNISLKKLKGKLNCIQGSKLILIRKSIFIMKSSIRNKFFFQLFVKTIFSLHHLFQLRFHIKKLMFLSFFISTQKLRLLNVTVNVFINLILLQLKKQNYELRAFRCLLIACMENCT